MILEFTKMNGAGNDFVMVDNRDGSRSLSRDQIAGLCNRHRGIGGDGLALGLVAVARLHGEDTARRINDGGIAEV